LSVSSEESWGELRLLVEREGGAHEGWEEELRSFLRLLRIKNKAVNLVSRASIDRLVELQVLPSLAGLPLLPVDRSLRVLDIGSGGGFPGIVLRILRPKIRLDLVEATQKKARFLEECVRELGFEDAAVHACRIETPSHKLLARSGFDIAFARAVGQEEALASSVKPLLRKGAALWAFSIDPRPGEEFRSWDASDGRRLTGLRRLVSVEVP